MNGISIAAKLAVSAIVWALNYPRKVKATILAVLVFILLSSLDELIVLPALFLALGAVGIFAYYLILFLVIGVIWWRL